MTVWEDLAKLREEQKKWRELKADTPAYTEDWYTIIDILEDLAESAAALTFARDNTPVALVAGIFNHPAFDTPKDWAEFEGGEFEALMAEFEETYNG